MMKRDQDENDTLRMVRLVIATIRAVLQGCRWGPAFASNGLTGDQDRVSAFIRGELESERLPLYQPVPPTTETLRLCWPSNRRVNEATVWLPLPDRNLAAASEALGPAPPAAPASAPLAPAAADPGRPDPSAPGASSDGASSSTVGAGAAEFVIGGSAAQPAAAGSTARLRLNQQTESQ